MNLYPKIIVGRKPIVRHLEGVNRLWGRLYICHNVKEVRNMVSELWSLPSYPDEISIYLPNPTRLQFEPLLKLMEESQLKLVLLVAYGCVPGTIVSRSMSFEKDEEVCFISPIKKLKVSNKLRAKLYDFFDVDI